MEMGVVCAENADARARVNSSSGEPRMKWTSGNIAQVSKWRREGRCDERITTERSWFAGEPA